MVLNWLVCRETSLPTFLPRQNIATHLPEHAVRAQQYLVREEVQLTGMGSGNGSSGPAAAAATFSAGGADSATSTSGGGLTQRRGGQQASSVPDAVWGGAGEGRKDL